VLVLTALFDPLDRVGALERIWLFEPLDLGTFILEELLEFD
jgi:hypothetical protein